MHIGKVKISNYALLKDVSVEFPMQNDQYAGWFVFAGANGCGKTTFLRAIVLSLGPPFVDRFSQYSPESFPVPGQATDLLVEWKRDAQDEAKHGELRPGEDFAAIGNIKLTHGLSHVTLEHLLVDGNLIPGRKLVQLPAWHGNKLRGFCVRSYGPKRRVGNFDDDVRIKKEEWPRAVGNLTLFGDRYCIEDFDVWLLKLNGLNDGILRLINDGLLDDSIVAVQFEEEKIWLTDVRGHKFSIVYASEGVRGLLSLVLDILRAIHQAFGTIDFDASGVVLNSALVLIDEPDNHLHPEWQMRLPNWFRTHFPNIQFIVATHSPFICQDADMIWRMDREDGQILVQPLGQETMETIRRGAISDLLESDAFRIYNTAGVSQWPAQQEYASLLAMEASDALTDEKMQRLLELREKLSKPFYTKSSLVGGIDPEFERLFPK